MLLFFFLARRHRMSDIFLGIFFMGIMLGVSFIDVNSWVPTILLLVSFMGLGVTAHIKNKG